MAARGSSSSANNDAFASKAICWASVSAIRTIIFPEPSKCASSSIEPGNAFMSMFTYELNTWNNPSSV
uniref:Uncharacterized protein n=1 Tax=Rhizophora mucronata TaxID=61149 RepID=A0A2P2JU14_RHIMU